MGAVKNSTNLISSVKRRAMLPEDDSTFSNDDFLEILSEELNLGLLASIMKLHEELYVYSYEQTITSGTTSYTIPPRAVANKLRNIRIKDSSGQYSSLTRIQPEDEADYTYYADAFYLKSNQVVFADAPSSGTLVMDIYLRPNQLVQTSRGATISSINTSTGVITFTGELPSHFTSSGTYDFVSYKAPCKIVAYDKTATAMDDDNYTLTFDTDDIPSTLVAGDYVTFAEETIVPQLPVELVPLLCQRAACYCLESIGDFEGLELAKQKLARMEENSHILIDNRSEGTPQKVIRRNSFMRGRQNSRNV